MKYISFLFLLSGVMLLVSCDPESSFEQIAEVEIPEHDERLAISANIEAGDKQIQVLVANSKKIFDDNATRTYPNANVQIYKNGDLLSNFTYDANDNLFKADLIDSIENDLSSYRLEVEESSLGTAWSEQQMPNKVEIQAIDYEFDRNFGDYRADVLEIELEDPSDEDNYYMLEAFQMVEFDAGQEPYFERIYLYPLFDQSEEGRNGTLFFDDARFGGQRFKLEAETSRSFNTDTEFTLIVRLKSISKDRFFFERSFGLYRNAEGNPFAEPVVVHDNIEDGYGIFTASAIDTEVIEF